MNTMANLRHEVANRLRDTLHGREIDTMEKGKPEIPHMLGVVTVGAISTPEAEAGTILDYDHEFWQNYYRDINTENGVKREIQTAIQSLKEDGLFRVTTPYGDDAGILYIEMDEIDRTANEMTTTCNDCGSRVVTEPELENHYGRYVMIFNLDCPECGFEATLEQQMNLTVVDEP